jgi:iron complex outermembrane recepter protein
VKLARYRWLRTAGTTCLLSVGALAGSQVLAQTAETGPGALEEVVVTAERRETNLQETAVSITAFDSQAIERTKATNVRELAEFVPNLSIMPSQYGDAAPNISIRGVGGGGALQSFGAASERNVAMYVDGLYYARVFGSVMKVTEIAGIEVLRGPQGTLFGRNTTGGAISYTSKKASLEDGFSGYVQLEGADFGTLNYKANVNIPLGERWAALVGGAKLDTDGYVERGNNPLNDDDTVAGIFNLHGEPTDNLTVDLNYTYTDSETHGTPSNFVSMTWNQIATDPTLGLRGHLGALSQAFIARGESPLVPNDPRLILGSGEVPRYCILDDNDPYTMGELCDTFNKNKTHVASLKLVYDLNDNIKLTSLTGGIDVDVDTLTDSYYTGGYARFFDQKSESFQQEFQVNFNYDRINAVAGLVYFKEDATEHETTIERLMTSSNGGTNATTGLPIPVVYAPSLQRERRQETYDYTTESMAAYGQATYSLTDWWDITGGLRYSEDKKEGHIFHIPSVSPAPAVYRQVVVDGDNDWSSTDYKVGMQFKPWDDFMFFVSRSKAFKAGIANDASGEQALASTAPAGLNRLPMLWLNPENVVANEVGVRTEWFDNRLRANVTYFDQNWEDRHTSNTRVINNFLVFETINSPGIINIKGFESEMLWAVTDSLTASFNYGLTEAESNTNPSFILDSVPRYNYTLGLQHVWESILGGAITSNVTYSYRDSSYSFSVDAANENDTSFSKAYGLYNASFDYTHESGKWSVSLWGRNLADKEYTFGSFAISGYTNPSFAGNAITATPQVVFFGPPRQIGATVRYNF